MITLRNWPVFILLILSFSFGCKEQNATIPPTVTPENQPVEPSQEITIDLTQLASDLVSDTLTIEIVNDRIFKKSKKFLAIPLLPILEKAIEENNLDIYSTQLVFYCTDGYKPTNLLQHVMEQGGGYLAFRDLEAPEGQSWLPENAQKYPPFFLVWQGLPSDDDLLAWPYGLYSLGLNSTEALFSSIYPDDQPALVPGFELFKRTCMRCHSINRIGGIMGPEFNYPKNVTTYWQREDIIAFAKNPQSYRYNSKMPAVTTLTDEEFNLIVDYLDYIKSRSLKEDIN